MLEVSDQRHELKQAKIKIQNPKIPKSSHLTRGCINGCHSKLSVFPERPTSSSVIPSAWCATSASDWSPTGTTDSPRTSRLPSTPTGTERLVRWRLPPRRSDPADVQASPSARKSTCIVPMVTPAATSFSIWSWCSTSKRAAPNTPATTCVVRPAASRSPCRYTCTTVGTVGLNYACSLHHKNGVLASELRVWVTWGAAAEASVTIHEDRINAWTAVLYTAFRITYIRCPPCIAGRLVGDG